MSRKVLLFDLGRLGILPHKPQPFDPNVYKDVKDWLQTEWENPAKIEARILFQPDDPMRISTLHAYSAQGYEIRYTANRGIAKEALLNDVLEKKWGFPVDGDSYRIGSKQKKFIYDKLRRENDELLFMDENNVVAPL